MALAFPPFGTKGPAVGLTIAAQTWCWDGIGGAVLVSSGFPLKPGQVSPVNLAQVRVVVAGVEQAVALHPLDGTFPDGSYRSLGIQFHYSLTHDVPVAAELQINQGPRATTDLTWVEPTKYAIMDRRAVIAPTDPGHLCGTFVTLSPLQPAVNDVEGAAWSAKAASSWTSYTRTGQNQGTAVYDHAHGLWAMYCRTGERTYYQWAYDWAIVSRNDPNSPIYTSAIPYVGPPTARVASAYIDYLVPVTVGDGPGTPPNPGNCTGNDVYNPEHLIGTSDCGGTNESFSMRYLSYASCYWMTAWRQFKRILQRQVQGWAAKANSSYALAQSDWISSVWGARYNMGVKLYATSIPAYLTECTTGFVQGALADFTYHYTTWLPWVLDILDDWVWAMGGGDYRDGLVGQRHETVTVAWAGDDRYGVTNFQLMLVAEYLMVYYDTVAPDARIPPWIKTIADYIISQSRAAMPTDPHYADPDGAVRWITMYLNTLPAMINDPTFTATTAIGTSIGALTANAHAVGATTITLFPSGSGSILVGDAVTFQGSTQVYRVTAGLASVAAGGPISITRQTDAIGPAVGLLVAIPSGPNQVAVVGTLKMTWTGGTVTPTNNNLESYSLSGPGITLASGTHVTANGVIGTSLILNFKCTVAGSGTYTIGSSAWNLAMFPSVFAWVYAYTGNVLYKTWADRAAFPGNITSLGTLVTKNWGEHFGGTRQSYFYYTNGGQIRATPGVHPTALVEPPDHPTLD